jgi:hypothetical protein
MPITNTDATDFTYTHVISHFKIKFRQNKRTNK